MNNIKSILVKFFIILEWQSARDITNFLSNMNGEKSILDLNLQTCQINSETLKKLAASKLISIKKLNLSKFGLMKVSIRSRMMELNSWELNISQT